MLELKRINKKGIALAILIVALFTLETVITYQTYAAKYPGISDFYSRWAGARALLIEGRDPYSLEVTSEIQKVIKIDPERDGIGKGGFAYPLPVIFTFFPLVYLPFDWTQAIWMTTLQWIAIITVFLLLAIERWRPSPLGLAGLILGVFAFYPVTRTFFLGQFTLHVTLFLAGTLWALNQDRDRWAGVCLAATCIKPQMVILLGPWFILWALVKRRWQFIWGLMLGGGALMIASLALFPRWPVSFLEDVQRYAQVAGGRNPISVILDRAWPWSPSRVRYGLQGLLLALMGFAWLRSVRKGSNAIDFNLAVHWTILVSLLVPFQTGTTNQAMLLIPLIAWLHYALRRWNRWHVLSVASSIIVGSWWLFVTTIHGDWEDPIMFLPFPILSLFILLCVEGTLVWRRRMQNK